MNCAHAWSMPINEKQNKMKTKKVQLTETQIQQLKLCAEQVNLLQTEIKTNDTLAVRHSKKSLGFAIKAGQYLNEAKKLLGHGKWEKWLSENVTCICKRTAENYMKLAKAATKAQYVALLTEADSLRQAYKRVGIINEKAKTEEATDGNVVPPATAPTETASKTKNTEAEITPEKVKETDKAQYDMKLNEAYARIRESVRSKIENANLIDWHLSTWAVEDNTLCSGDEANHGAALVQELQNWAGKLECSSITPEDEFSAKLGIVLTEVVAQFIAAINPTTTEAASTGEGLVPPLSSELMSLAKESVSLVEEATCPQS